MAALKFNMQVFIGVYLLMFPLVLASPLSDDFIEEINRKATTWKVIIFGFYRYFA